MKQQCTVLFCGCFKYSTERVGECELCACNHKPEQHSNTCECGGRRYFGVCNYKWLCAVLLAVEIVACVVVVWSL